MMSRVLQQDIMYLSFHLSFPFWLIPLIQHFLIKLEARSIEFSV